MKTHEIYWSDLTPEAQERLKDLNDDNVELAPLAIIELEDDDYRDKNGFNMSIGDRVLVPEPNENDTYNHEFAGTIKDFDEGYAIVVDGDDEVFMIEPERLEVIDDNE